MPLVLLLKTGGFRHVPKASVRTLYQVPMGWDLRLMSQKSVTCFPFLVPLLFSLLFFEAPELQHQPKAVRQMTCSGFGSSMRIPNNLGSKQAESASETSPDQFLTTQCSHNYKICSSCHLRNIREIFPIVTVYRLSTAIIYSITYRLPVWIPY